MGYTVYAMPKGGRFYKSLEDCEPRDAALELISREVSRYSIEGAVAELGVYRGDFAKRINHFFPDKKLYLFDTFAGFDGRDAVVDRERKFSTGDQDFSRTSEQLVLDKMEHRENCIVKKGWFPETAEGVQDKFCFVSLDVDLYKPTLAGLNFFYPRLIGGWGVLWFMILITGNIRAFVRRLRSSVSKIASAMSVCRMPVGRLLSPGKSLLCRR